MHVRVSSYASAALVIVMLAAIACEDSPGMVHGRGVTIPTAVPSTFLIARPATVVPNFVFAPGCSTLLPFNLNLSVVVNDGQDVTVRLTAFELIDRSGAHVFPTSISTMRNTSPVPMPSSLPIPIPGVGARTMPVSLQFGCGVTPAGTLVISAETLDSAGLANVTRLSVRIGA